MKSFAIAGLFFAGFSCAATLAANGTEGPWNSPPYRTAPPLVTSTDKDIDDAIDAITTFPTTLDPRLWDGDRMRPEVRARAIEIAKDLLADLKIPDVTIKNVEVQGSTVSYEYDGNADLSLRVFLDTSGYKGDVHSLNTLLKTYTDYLEAVYEGRLMLHGVPVEPQFYAIKTQSLEPQKGIGHYSVTRDAWMEHPAMQENRFDRAQMKADAQRYIMRYNDLVSSYFASKKGFDCSRFKDFTQEFRAYRGAGIDKDGTRSTTNLTYRMLRRLNVNVSETVRQLGVECRTIQWSLE